MDNTNQYNHKMIAYINWVKERGLRPFEKNQHQVNHYKSNSIRIKGKLKNPNILAIVYSQHLNSQQIQSENEKLLLARILTAIGEQLSQTAVLSIKKHKDTKQSSLCQKYISTLIKNNNAKKIICFGSLPLIPQDQALTNRLQENPGSIIKIEETNKAPMLLTWELEKLLLEPEKKQSTWRHLQNFIKKFGEKNTIIISAEIETQLNSLNEEEKKNYMEMLGVKEAGIKILTKKGYNLLNLETFFTSGPEESRAWTISKNCLAPNAAGKIHSDFEKGFIKVETVSYNDFINNKGWINSKNIGKMRLEGKEYIVKDGDVLNFRFNT